jgi:hypothetical protein
VVAQRRLALCRLPNCSDKGDMHEYCYNAYFFVTCWSGGPGLVLMHVILSPHVPEMHTRRIAAVSHNN